MKCEYWQKCFCLFRALLSWIIENDHNMYGSFYCIPMLSIQIISRFKFVQEHTHNLSRVWCVTIMKIILVSLFIHTRKEMNEKYGYFPAILENLGELIGLSLFVNQSIQILRIELFSSIWCYKFTQNIQFDLL